MPYLVHYTRQNKVSDDPTSPDYQSSPESRVTVNVNARTEERAIEKSVDAAAEMGISLDGFTVDAVVDLDD